MCAIKKWGIAHNKIYCMCNVHIPKVAKLLLYTPLVVFLDLPYLLFNEWHRTTRIKNQKSCALTSNVQKHDKAQSCISWLPSYVRLTSLTMVNFSNLERVDIVILYGVADENARLAGELWIERLPNCAISFARTFISVQHRQDHGTFKP